jgi:hypothetical protein
MQFAAFDVPRQAGLPFENRMEILQQVMDEYRKSGGKVGFFHVSSPFVKVRDISQL